MSPTIAEALRECLDAIERLEARVGTLEQQQETLVAVYQNLTSRFARIEDWHAVVEKYDRQRAGGQLLIAEDADDLGWPDDAYFFSPEE